MGKHKIVALALTLILPGLGYIYLGRKMLFGLMLLIAGIGNLMWHYTVPNGFEVNAFFIAAVVGYYGAILLDTFYTAEAADVIDAMAIESDDKPPARNK